MLIHVTGANGQVGKEVLNAISGMGTVYASDIEDMNITDSHQVSQVICKQKPDVIIHIAALKGNQPSRNNPTKFFSVNTLGTLNLLEACRTYGVNQFIFLSSLTVHGSSASPVQENSTLLPMHPYAATKCASESMLQSYVHSYGIRGIAFRPNFIVGPINYPTPYTDNIVYDFIQSIIKTGFIELAGTGEYQREWLHPKDVARAIALSISSKPAGFDAYILSGERVTMTQLAEKVINLVGRGLIKSKPDMDGFSLVSNDQKAKQELGWQPQINLDSLISEIWNEYKSRNDT
ncbi:MAG: NAD(P)-dependent oxidoreductase [Chloroflexota bacterium]|nr:NAD(P)-dependent oxidoreductase [Chloroflexota bacterium]